MHTFDYHKPNDVVFIFFKLIPPCFDYMLKATSTTGESSLLRLGIIPLRFYTAQSTSVALVDSILSAIILASLWLLTLLYDL